MTERERKSCYKTMNWMGDPDFCTGCQHEDECGRQSMAADFEHDRRKEERLYSNER